MKLLIIASLLATTAPAFASTCPSVDKVIENAKKGRIEFNTPYDFSLDAAVASATLCNIENSDVITLCETKIGLLKDLVKSAQAAFEVGETTRTVVLELENKLSTTTKACQK
jgi:hypothetical protein